MIPNIFHFIFGLEETFAEKPFSIAHYLAIKSAVDINKPKKVFFYYQFEPSGYWWEKAKKLVELNQISPPKKIFGKNLIHYAHKSDILRLLILEEFGGIYLDIDTICIKPFDNLLNYKCVMGQESYLNHIQGLCNAVILAEPKSLFINHWIESYADFRSLGRDSFWNEHSVIVPYFISKKFPDLIHVLNNNAFFYPSYGRFDLDLLFKKCEVFPDAYLFHLWETVSYEKYIKNLSKKDIIKIDTSYNVIARRFF